MSTEELIQCQRCGVSATARRWEEAFLTCPQCGHHTRIRASERMRLHFDPDSFTPYEHGLSSADPLEWEEPNRKYQTLLEKARQKSGTAESLLTGSALIEGMAVSVGAFEFSFLGGTLGPVTGELVARLLEDGLKYNRPVVLFTMTGGARMQEGMNSLLQMAKIAVALRAFQDQGGFLITVLCDPTTGGVAASIGFMGDLILAEPGALVGFSGPRVIEESIGQELPPGFQHAQHRLGQGLVDQVVDRKDLRSYLARAIRSSLQTHCD